MKKNKQRYETVTYNGVKGIRKDLKSDKYHVEKYIRGERYYATFFDIKDAADWKKNFHPSLSLNGISNLKIKEVAKKRLQKMEAKKNLNGIKRINGNDLGFSFSDVWEMYIKKHLSKIEESSKIRRLNDAMFYSEIMNIKMIKFDADLISEHIQLRKEIAINNLKSRRFNFDNDLKNLKAVFNWYRENYDEQFVNPILKRHKDEGVIKKIRKKKKKMKKHELLAFFDALESDSLFWRDFAETQFYFASRVQEVAGLLKSSVDLISKTAAIENVMVWGQDKNFLYLKDSPKNNEDREVFLNGKLLDIMKRRIEDHPCRSLKVCPNTGVSLNLIFHRNGRPLSYRAIQYRYNKALKKAGLSEKFSSTHIMRHTMANMVRSKLGLDSAQAVGGWKTRELVEKVYTETPVHVGATARNKIESFLGENDENISSENPVQTVCTGLRLIKS